MADDIRDSLKLISDTLNAHRSESEKREKRMFDEVNKISIGVRKAQETADKAVAMALDASRAAVRASDAGEGNDHAIFAEMGSLKVVLNEANTKLTGHIESTAKLADKIEETQKHVEEEQRKEKRARRAWRVAQPTIIAALTVLANQIIAPGATVRNAVAGSASTTPTVITVDAGK